MGQDGSESEEQDQEHNNSDSNYAMRSSESSFYTADEDVANRREADNEVREYKKKLMWQHPHRDPEQAFRARAHEAISDVNRKRRDSTCDDQSSTFRECFYAMEYDYSWREVMILFFYLMEMNLINPPTVTITRAHTKHGNEFNYKLSTALPWVISKVVDLETVDFMERGHIDCETQITAYTLANVTTKSGGKYHVTEYCEYQQVAEGKCTFRKMIKTECPDWIPDFAVDKACDIYIKSTAKRCKKNVAELVKGLSPMKAEASPALLAFLDKMGLSFDPPAVGVSATAVEGAASEGEGDSPGLRPSGTPPGKHIRTCSQTGRLEEFSTPRHMVTPKSTKRTRSKERKVTPRSGASTSTTQNKLRAGDLGDLVNDLGDWRNDDDFATESGDHDPGPVLENS